MSAPLLLGIGLPAYGMTTTAWQAEAWFKLGFAYAHAEAQSRFRLRMFTTVDVCGIDVARNRLMSEAITADCDWLLMVDADTWHSDGFDLLQMISTADREQANVVAARVPRRDPDNPHFMIYNEQGLVVDAPPGSALVPIASAATAMMAIDVNFVRQKLSPPWFKFEWREGAVKPHKSEDLYFCERVRAAGGKIVADFRFAASHLGRTPVHSG